MSNFPNQTKRQKNPAFWQNPQLPPPIKTHLKKGVVMNGSKGYY